MADNLKTKIKKLKAIKDFGYLIKEKQNKSKIIKYYKINKLAYLLFHNTLGYIHMGISKTNKFKKSDLLEQLIYIKEAILKNNASNVLELGYGMGANMNYLAKIFPDKKFIGIDLSSNQLKKHSQNKNTSFIKGDFHNLKNIDDKFDIVYAIETINYSDRLQEYFEEVYSVMNSGSYFIIFDGYYLKNRENLDADTKLACYFTEKGMAIEKPHQLDDVTNSAKKIGFILDKQTDFTKNILPSLYRFEKKASAYVNHPKIAKFINFIFPEIFIRNALSGYLMPDLMNLGISGYYMHIFYKK